MMRHRLPFLRFRPVIYGASPTIARLAALQASTIAHKEAPSASRHDGALKRKNRKTEGTKDTESARRRSR